VKSELDNKNNEQQESLDCEPTEDKVRLTKPVE
jgi:hypothetical protein